MDNPNANKTTRLDWSKLLGFDQINRVGAELKLSDLGFSKIGSKTCTGPRPIEAGRT